jgi:predicted nucleotidyltransferase
MPQIVGRTAVCERYWVAMIQETQRPPIDDALIEEITRKIVDAFHPRRVILFGSRARGDYHMDSDIDLFVEMESSDDPVDRFMKVNGLFKRRRWSMDLIVMTPDEVVQARTHPYYSIVPTIEKTGRVLFSDYARS